MAWEKSFSSSTSDLALQIGFHLHNRIHPPLCSRYSSSVDPSSSYQCNNYLLELVIVLVVALGMNHLYFPIDWIVESSSNLLARSVRW